MPPKIYMFLGDGGYLFSPGFSMFGDNLSKAGYDVVKIADSGRDMLSVRRSIEVQPKERPIIFLGYSLGANGCAWNARYNATREIALIVGFDPTRNGPSLSLYPIGKNVKRCICFQQVSMLSPISWFFGRSKYVAAKDGPKIEVIPTKNDHIVLQYDPNLQHIAIDAIHKAAPLRG